MLNETATFIICEKSKGILNDLRIYDENESFCLIYIKELLLSFEIMLFKFLLIQFYVTRFFFSCFSRYPCTVAERNPWSWIRLQGRESSSLKVLILLHSHNLNSNSKPLIKLEETRPYHFIRAFLGWSCEERYDLLINKNHTQANK